MQDELILQTEWSRYRCPHWVSVVVVVSRTADVATELPTMAEEENALRVVEGVMMMMMMM
jgi:hypothetical protein